MIPGDRITVEQLIRLRIPRHELLIDLTRDEACELLEGLDKNLGPRLVIGLDMGDPRGDRQATFTIPIQEPGPTLADDIERMIADHIVDANEKVDDADEQEAEFLSRLPRADIEPGEAEILVQAQPIKCPSNTPEPAAEPEKAPETPARSNDRQVKIGRPRLPVSDQDRAVELWTRYRKRFPDEGLNRTVSRLCSHYPQPRPTADEIREWLRAAGVDIPTPMSRSECAAQARDCRLRKPPEGYKIVNAEVWRASESLLSDADIREMAEGGLARAGLVLESEAVGW